MTEKELRQSYVNAAVSYLGCKESNGSHKKIIDLYNSHKPLARNYAVTAPAATEEKQTQIATTAATAAASVAATVAQTAVAQATAEVKAAKATETATE